jgi:hypothetical protein
MPRDKNTGVVSLKKSGRKTTIEVLFPEGIKLRDALKIVDTVKAEAVRKFQPGPCTMCLSGRDFRLRDIKVLPARLTKNMAEFDVRSGKLMG